MPISLKTKIDSLVEWRKKYPKIKITPIASEEELREYAKTDEEFSQIQEEYKKMQSYYEYIRVRKSQGKLEEEQISICKEGDIEGVFGYPTRIEELAKKYGITEKDIDYILTEYGTLDNFYEAYKKGYFYRYKDGELAEKIIKVVVVDIDGNSNIGYSNLYRAILGEETTKKDALFYSSKELQKLLEKLDEREKYILESIYGLIEGRTPTTGKNLGEEIGLSGTRVAKIRDKALRKMRHPLRVREDVFRIEDDEHITDDERQQIEELIKDVKLQNGDLSENLKKLKSIYELIKNRTEDKKREEERKIKEREQKEKEERRKRELKYKLESDWIPIEELLSYSLLTYRDLLDMGINPELAAKHIIEINKYKSEKEEIERLNLDRLYENHDLSTRAYMGLKMSEIKSLVDLSRMTKKQLMNVGRNRIGIKTIDEIIATMQKYGVSFIDEEHEEYGQNEEVLKEIREENRKEENKILKKQIESGLIPLEKLVSFSYMDLLEIGIEPELADKCFLEIKKYKTRKENEESEKLSRSIDELEFSLRTYNCLRKAGINTIGDLLERTREELRGIKGLGKTSYDELIDKMQEYGISFKNEEQGQDGKKEEVLKEIRNEERQKENRILKERIERGLIPLEELVPLPYEKILEIGLNPKLEARLIALNKEYISEQQNAVTLASSIAELEMSFRTYNCLRNAGIKTIGDLLEKTREELRGIRGLGKKSYDELINIMHKYEESLKNEGQEENERRELLGEAEEICEFVRDQNRRIKELEGQLLGEPSKSSNSEGRKE